MGEIKSLEARTKSFLTFLNMTQRKVDLIWLNYVGLPVVYKTLLPGQYTNINTFVTHPWTFRDSDTRDKLCVNNQEIFFPEPWNPAQCRLESTNGQVFVFPERTRLLITVPVYSLLLRAMQVLRDNLTDEVKRVLVTKEVASAGTLLDCLELPKALNQDLVYFVKKSYGAPTT